MLRTGWGWIGAPEAAVYDRGAQAAQAKEPEEAKAWRLPWWVGPSGDAVGAEPPNQSPGAFCMLAGDSPHHTVSGDRDHLLGSRINRSEEVRNRKNILEKEINDTV